MYIPALLNWWSIVKWIKTKNGCIIIYIYIYMPITLCNTSENGRATNHMWTILVNDLYKLALMRSMCLKHLKCWPLVVSEATISQQRMQSYYHRGQDEDPIQRLPTRQASGRQLETMSSSSGADFFHAEDYERGRSTM